MSQLVVSQLTQKGVRPLNEDRVLANESKQLFGVFDGASSLDKYLSPEGKTGAYIAAQIAAETFENAGDNSLKEIAIKANNNIESAHIKADIDLTKNVNRFSTTAVVARISKGNVELFQSGDSIALIIYKDGHAEVPISYHDHDNPVMRKWRQLADSGATNIRNIVAHDVIKLRESANSAYGILNGDKRFENFLKTAVINLENVATILLLSDGMFIPKSDPNAEEDWNGYVRLYQEGGLKKIYDTVREMEDSDPELIKYPRYKLHDDASAVAIDGLLSGKQ